MNTRTHPPDSLWMMTAAPLLWAAHFLLSYATAAVWCAKQPGFGGPLGAVRLAIGVYTVVALGGIVFVGWIGFRRHAPGPGVPSHHHDTPLSRHRFLGFATLLLAGLSAVATIYVALTVFFFSTCY